MMLVKTWHSLVWLSVTQTVKCCDIKDGRGYRLVGFVGLVLNIAVRSSHCLIEWMYVSNGHVVLFLGWNEF
jgi:hypothetical protein